MTLKELLKKLKGFDCEALQDKPVTHCFASRGSGYKEDVVNVVYDAKAGVVRLLCDEPEPFMYYRDALLVIKDKEPKK